MLIYLAENTPWLPGHAYSRALVYQWLFFEQYSHEPYIAVARFIVHLAKTADSKKKRLRYLWKYGNAALKVMEHRLGEVPFMAGERFTIADIALYAYTHTAEDGGFELQAYPNIRRWLGLVQEQDGFVPMEEACR
jgi:glutathione S-transferase